MRQIPNHPVIRRMERDGCLSDCGGVHSCESCECPIYEGERYFDIGGVIFCTDCREAALEEATCFA